MDKIGLMHTAALTCAYPVSGRITVHSEGTATHVNSTLIVTPYPHRGIRSRHLLRENGFPGSVQAGVEEESKAAGMHLASRPRAVPAGTAHT